MEAVERKGSATKVHRNSRLQHNLVCILSRQVCSKLEDNNLVRNKPGMVVGTKSQRDGLPTSCCTWVGKRAWRAWRTWRAWRAPVLVLAVVLEQVAEQQGLGLVEVEEVVVLEVVARVVRVDLGDLEDPLVQEVELGPEVLVDRWVCTGLTLEEVGQLEILCSSYRKVVSIVVEYILA